MLSVSVSLVLFPSQLCVQVYRTGLEAEFPTSATSPHPPLNYNSHQPPVTSPLIGWSMTVAVIIMYPSVDTHSDSVSLVLIRIQSNTPTPLGPLKAPTVLSLAIPENPWGPRPHRIYSPIHRLQPSQTVSLLWPNTVQSGANWPVSASPLQWAFKVCPLLGRQWHRLPTGRPQLMCFIVVCRLLATSCSLVSWVGELIKWPTTSIQECCNEVTQSVIGYIPNDTLFPIQCTNLTKARRALGKSTVHYIGKRPLFGMQAVDERPDRWQVLQPTSESLQELFGRRNYLLSSCSLGARHNSPSYDACRASRLKQHRGSHNT